MSPEYLTAKEAAQVRAAVKERYASVSRDPHGQVSYPVGRESLARLGYRAEWLASVPSAILDRFVGVGNPFSIRRVEKGERVLDVGCGCSLDAFVAASLVRKAQTFTENLRFLECSVEALPFDDESFDLVISNGVLNLVPDKDAAFREIARVLRHDGDFVAADLIVMQTIPEDDSKSVDAWSA